MSQIFFAETVARNSNDEVECLDVSETEAECLNVSETEAEAENFAENSNDEVECLDVSSDALSNHEGSGSLVKKGPHSSHETSRSPRK